MEQLVPKIRFPEFKEDEDANRFKKYPFQDIFNFSTGKNIKQKEASPEYDIPCVRYGELYHMYNEVINEIINKTNIDKSELLFSEGDEILLPSAGEDPLDIGSASALTIKNVAIGRTINILKPKFENIYSQIFASYYINHRLKKEIASLAKGVSISNVYNSDLKKLKIILPNLLEQQKIATFLTAIDNQIELLEKQKVKLTIYKKGVSQQLFSQELSFKDDNGNDFPDWEEKKLGDLFDFYRGSNLSKNDITIDGKNYCIHYGELFKIYNEQIKQIQSKTNNNGVKSKIGDILMPSSDVTPTGLATASCILKDNVILGGDINILRPNTTIDSLYMSYYINFSKEKIIKIVTGTTVKHIYNKDIKILFFSISTSLKEQQKIASFLSAIDVQIEDVAEQINRSKEYKKGLLQQMFV